MTQFVLLICLLIGFMLSNCITFFLWLETRRELRILRKLHQLAQHNLAGTAFGRSLASTSSSIQGKPNGKT